MTFLRSYNCAYILQIQLIQLTLVGCVQVCVSDEDCIGSNLICKRNKCICPNGQDSDPPVTTDVAVLDTIVAQKRNETREKAMYIHKITSTFTFYLFLTLIIGLSWYGLYLAVLNRLRRAPMIVMRQVYSMFWEQSKGDVAYISRETWRVIIVILFVLTLMAVTLRIWCTRFREIRNLKLEQRREAEAV